MYLGGNPLGLQIKISYIQNLLQLPKLWEPLDNLKYF